MKAKLLLALGAGLLTGAAQAQNIDFKLSGQINRALLHANDGYDSDWFNVDNGNSSTRFRFNAEGDVVPGVKAGILWEVEYKSNSSSAVNFPPLLPGRTVAPTLDERHMDIFFRGRYGTLRLGQGDGAANGAAEVDLSGTTVAHYSATPDIGGAFEYRTGSAFSGTSISASISNQDFESRYDRLHYISPSFSGFTGEVSWGHKATDIVEAAVRYSGKLESMGTIAGALGFSSEDSPTPTTNDTVIGGSASWLHPSGFNLTFTHTIRDLPGREGKFSYLKAGYKLSAEHAMSIDFATGKDQALAGDNAKMYGIGYVYTPIAWAEIFGLLKQHNLDRPGVSLDSIRFFMVGSRIKF